MHSPHNYLFDNGLAYKYGKLKASFNEVHGGKVEA